MSIDSESVSEVITVRQYTLSQRGSIVFYLLMGGINAALRSLVLLLPVGVLRLS